MQTFFTIKSKGLEITNCVMYEMPLQMKAEIALICFLIFAFWIVFFSWGIFKSFSIMCLLVAVILSCLIAFEILKITLQ